ncbi:hypothetical protein HPB47_026503 [Ixodes persulcatus]|uniref:Uncharacterized protein n=1 Tax=Ixodes persulcatus TaxID=34615 RepID=A0AC60Q0G0_IXOPE|nr:hypothetical protein HPB47_026503 [Ixodes persulcatus]
MAEDREDVPSEVPQHVDLEEKTEKELSFHDAMAIADAKIHALISNDPLLSNLHPEVTVEELRSYLALEHGQAMSLRVLRADWRSLHGGGRAEGHGPRPQESAAEARHPSHAAQPLVGWRDLPQSPHKQTPESLYGRSRRGTVTSRERALGRRQLRNVAVHATMPQMNYGCGRTAFMLLHSQFARKGVKRVVSWRYIWRTYWLSFEGQPLNQDRTLLRDAGIRNNSELCFIKRRRER